MTDIGTKALALRVAEDLDLELASDGPETFLPIILAFSDEEARALAAFLREAVSPWRPIETAPKDGTDILLFGCRDTLSYQVAGSWWNDAWRSSEDGISTLGKPTHWMPLPTPPARIEDSEEPSYDRR